MSNSPNLYCLKRRDAATNKLEVHILNGADNFQTFSLHTDTALFAADAPNCDFAVADYNGDGHPDVFCLKKINTGAGNGTVEVHVLNGADNFQTFLLHAGTPLGAADCDFALADYNRDGRPDVFGLKKNNTGTGTFEVHVLNGADNFQTFLLHTGTPLSTSDSANCDFAVADYNGDGHPDVFCLKKNNRDGTFEVHVLNGADNFQTFLLHTGTPLGTSDSAENFLFKVPIDTAIDLTVDPNFSVNCKSEFRAGRFLSSARTRPVIGV
jgi:hypothetical protein